MKEKKLYEFVQKIVEEGTSHQYTLLHIHANAYKNLTMQKLMKIRIDIKCNNCHHCLEINFKSFLENNKECSSCNSFLQYG